MSFTDSFISANMDKFPSKHLPNLRERMSTLDEKQANIVISTKLCNPQTALILSIFLGVLGIDRFYIGNTMLGIAKLLLSWATFGLWWFIDLFLITKAAKESNLNAINTAISTAKAISN